jgi:hypothetical protein
MKRTILAAVASLTLLAACGSSVDRTGTRDNLLKALKANGLTASGSCVDSVLGKYTDAELKAMDAQLGKNDSSGKAGELVAALLACGTPTTT